MPHVNVYCRQDACALTPTPDTVVISISNPGDPAPLLEGWGAVLRLEFQDFVTVPEGVENTVIFTEEHAKAVDLFVNGYQEKNFMVHCDAGVSRSVAVGLFIHEIFEHELTLHAIHTTKAANSLVLRTLMRRYWSEQFEKGKS